MPKVLGQSGTDVSSQIITSDTTWTQTGSPYTFQGPVAVATGITLTLDPGVTVNIGTYCLTVNGTLNSQGTNANPVHINAVDTGYATLVLNAIGDSSAIGSGGIIENTVFSTLGVQVYGGNPEFENDWLTGLEVFGGSSFLSENTINGSVFVFDSTQITDNTILGIIAVEGGTSIISDNTITTSNTYGAGFQGEGQTKEYYGVQIEHTSSRVISAVITNNTIATGIYSAGTEASEISDNTITGGGITFAGGGGTISDNSISGGISILAGGGSYTITDNLISSGSTAGIYMAQGGGQMTGFGFEQTPNTALIERNLITDNNQYGLQLLDDATVLNNTISNSNTSIYLQSAQATFNYNNIEGYSQNSLHIQSDEANINATYNWWGTTNTQAINQTIIESDNTYNLGNVTFVPFLTAPNPQAMPNPNAVLTTLISSTPSPTPSATTQPTPSSSLASPNPTVNLQNPTVGIQTKTAAGFNWIEVALFIALAVIVALVGVVVAMTVRHRKTANLKQ